MESERQLRILIVGLGNVLMMDDGVGVHAIKELQKDPPGGEVCVAEVGTAVLGAVHLFEWADRILAIDAVKAGGPPGAIYAFDAEGSEDRGHRMSLHELNLLGALRFIGSAHPRPPVVILGVEPAVIDYGMDLSETVRAVLPQVVEAAREIVDGWQQNRETWTLEKLKGATARVESGRQTPEVGMPKARALQARPLRPRVHPTSDVARAQKSEVLPTTEF